jgi:uncharacterized protein (TIGR02145 family)
MIGAPSGRSQDLDGVVVGNSLIFSENGNTQLLKIDLDDYNVSVFRNLSGLPGSSISCIDYNDGQYYVCSADVSGRYIYSFIEGQLEELICTMPSGSSYITSIKVFDNYVYATLNYEYRILKIDISTGDYTVFYQAPPGTFYPVDIEGINLTSFPAPTAASVAATDVAITNAALNGIVNANDISTTVTFEYWTENSEISTSPATPSPVTGAYNTAVSADITGLDAGTTYYFRVKAENNEGASFSDVLTFTTHKSDAIKDFDENYYNIVTIGSQTWMAENLETTSLNNGDPIQTRTNPSEWVNLATGANQIPGYCWYDNEISNKQEYGALYNFWAADAENLCPTGWHVPNGDEWFSLILTLDPGANPDMFIGPLSTTAGGELKEAGTVHWLSPNDATNGSGFTALPGGYRDNSGAFSRIGERGFFWLNDLQSRALFYNNSSVTGSEGSLPSGRSVRCLKNALPTVTTNNISSITFNSAQSG